MPSIVVNRSVANTTAIVNPSEAGPATSGWRSFLQLQGEVARRMGNRADLDTDDVKLHINEAYVELCAMLDLVQMDASMEWSTTAEEPLYALPSSIREVISLQCIGDTSFDDEGPLEKIDLFEYRRRAQDDTDLAMRPTSFALSPDNTIALWRMPDIVYTMSMEVKLRPALLSADADYPVLADEWIDPLTILSVAKAASGLSEFELSAQRQNEALGMIRSRRNERAERKTGAKGGIFMPTSARDLRRSDRGGYR